MFLLDISHLLALIKKILLLFQPNVLQVESIKLKKKKYAFITMVLEKYLPLREKSSLNYRPSEKFTLKDNQDLELCDETFQEFRPEEVFPPETIWNVSREGREEKGKSFNGDSFLSSLSETISFLRERVEKKRELSQKRLEELENRLKELEQELSGINPLCGDPNWLRRRESLERRIAETRKEIFRVKMELLEDELERELFELKGRFSLLVKLFQGWV